MSRWQKLITAVVLLFSAGQAIEAAQPATKPVVVCSTTQIADFVREVVGDRMTVHCILAPGQDPHLYERKPADLKLVGGADLCFENGWHLEGNDWMRQLAEQAGVRLVTCVTGCEPLQLQEEGAEVRDPHAWFSPTNAAVYVRNIRDAVVELDPDHAAEYQARAALYLDQLRTLHAWTQRQVNQIPPDRRVLVTSHDAFNYFCKAYGFQSATPSGWSTGAEVGAGLSPKRRQDTVDSIRQFGVKAIFVETSVNPTTIREIAREAGVVIGGELYSDSMGPPGSAGETYIGMMRENVITLVQALK